MNGSTEEGLGQNDVTGTTGERQDQNPEAVAQAQELSVDNVGSSHTAAEDHGNEDEVDQRITQEELLTGQHVTHSTVQDNTQNGSSTSGGDGNEQCLSDGLSLSPQVLIGVDLDFIQLGNELVAFSCHDVSVGDGDQEDDQNGREANDSHNQEERIERKVSGGLNSVKLVHYALGIFYISHYVQPPS